MFYAKLRRWGNAVNVNFLMNGLHCWAFSHRSNELQPGVAENFLMRSNAVKKNQIRSAEVLNKSYIEQFKRRLFRWFILRGERHLFGFSKVFIRKEILPEKLLRICCSVHSKNVPFCVFFVKLNKPLTVVTAGLKNFHQLYWLLVMIAVIVQSNSLF